MAKINNWIKQQQQGGGCHQYHHLHYSSFVITKTGYLFGNHEPQVQAVRPSILPRLLLRCFTSFHIAQIGLTTKSSNNQCKGWCERRPQSWASKCTWRDCSACSACSGEWLWFLCNIIIPFPSFPTCRCSKMGERVQIHHNYKSVTTGPINTINVAACIAIIIWHHQNGSSVWLAANPKSSQSAATTTAQSFFTFFPHCTNRLDDEKQ